MPVTFYTWDVCSMKKIKLSVLLLTCLFSAALLFSGCGILEKEAEEEISFINKFIEETEEEDSKETAFPEEEESSTMYSTVEEYVSDPAVRTDIEAQINMDGTGLHLEIGASGNTLIYSAYFDEQLTVNDPKQHGEITESLAESCTVNAAAYLQLAEDLKTVIAADEIAVRICYFNADGGQLYHCTYDKCGKTESVAARFLQTDIQSSLSEEIAASEGSGVGMSVYAANDALVYDYTYSEQLDLSDPAIRTQVEEALAAACNEASATYVGIAAELRSVAHGDNIRVQLIYRNADGSIIYTCTFQ